MVIRHWPVNLLTLSRIYGFRFRPGLGRMEVGYRGARAPQWGHPQDGSASPRRCQSTLNFSAQLMALDPLSSPRSSVGDVPASTTQLANPHANPPRLAAAFATPNVPAPFLTKTYDLVDDPDTNTVISWSIEGNSFVVWNSPELCQRLLPRYFKHNNFSSFVRQLNTYGFRKIDPERWEFANDEFQRGKRHLLRGIHRRKAPAASALAQQHHYHHSGSSNMFPSGSIVEVGKFGVEGEIERLKRDKNVLMMEVMCLRQQLQSTEGDLHAMWQRLQTTETCQQHMVSFIAKAMHNPGFLAQIMQQSNTEIAEIVPKRRRLKDQSTASIADDLDTTNEFRLLSGNVILNPIDQQHLSVRGMEAESLMRAEAYQDEMQLVNQPLKTLDELVEESSLMRSAAMSLEYHNGGIADFMQDSSSSPRMTSQSNQSSSACGAPPCGNIHPYNRSLPAVISTCGEQQGALNNLKAEARSSRLLDQHYMPTSSSSQAEHYYEHDIGVSASRSSVRCNTQYSAGTLQEGVSAAKHAHAAHQYDLYHAADGPPLRQYDKCRAAEGHPARQYDYFKPADGIPTYRAADGPIHSVSNPSYWGGLGMAMAGQQARHAPEPSYGEALQAAQGHQKDNSKNIDPIRWMRDL